MWAFFSSVMSPSRKLAISFISEESKCDREGEDNFVGEVHMYWNVARDVIKKI